MSAACNLCKDEYWIDDNDITKCKTCKYPVGPVENKLRDQLCFENPYNKNRIVPPFPQNSVAIDWRT